MYIGALGGLATLSGDGSSNVTATSAATSLYDPQNGGAASLFWGWHLFKYVSVQGNYIWNRNDLTLTATLSNPPASSFYKQPMSSTENAFIGDVLVYFRPRGDRIRPYLSQGGGVLLFSSHPNGGAISSGSLLAPPGNSSSAFPGSRTAVGLDVRVAHAWYLPLYVWGEHQPQSRERAAFATRAAPAQEFPEPLRDVPDVLITFS